MRTSHCLTVVLLTLALTLAGCGGSSGQSSFTPPSSSSSGASSSGASSSGASSSGASSSSSSSGSSANVVPVVVGPGPAAAGSNALNSAYVSVKVCLPGTKTCGTIDNVLVDTGSFGLQLFSSVLKSAGVILQPMADPSISGNTIAECVAFVEGYVWGPVAKADVQIGGETVSNLSIHVLNDDGSYAPTVPHACTAMSSNTNLTSVAAFGANGVLGVGFLPQDCGAACAQCNSIVGGCTSTNDIYYSCGNGTTCPSVQVALASQVTNPVALFATDNNGVILKLPVIPDTGAASPSGSLIFGIGTQSNNSIGTAAVLTLDDFGSFTTVYNGSALNSSFIDSGSNGYFFDDSTLARSLCGSTAPSNQLYCPSTTLTLSASNQGHTPTGTPTGAMSLVMFKVANLHNIPANDSHGNLITALDDYAGVAATSNGTAMLNNDFDWGLPFFFGRSVYTKIAGTAESTASGPAGPFVAY